MTKRTVAALVAVALGGGGVGCKSTPSTSFELDVPTAVSSNAAWYEIGIFAGACPPPALLLGGIPVEGVLGRVSFAAGSAAPAFGSLAKEAYGIAAVARAADCSVVATGCSNLAVTNGATLAVSLAAVGGTPQGACSSGSICDEAACTPSNDASAGATVACSLSLVGQGPLGDPLDSDATLLSAPAISATPDGFLIAYREFDPNTGNARLTTLSIDTAGASAAPIQTTLPGGCTGSPATDATGLVFSGASGTVAVSRPACPGADGGASAGGIDVLAIDASGSIKQSSFSGQPGLDLTLGAAHALTTTPSGVVLAYTNAAMATSFAASIDGVSIATSPAPVAFAGSTDLSTTAAYAVGTTYGTAYVALGLGADGGTVPQASVTTAGDAGTGTAYFPAAWASVSGVGSRFLVASNGPSATSSILWSAFDVGHATATATGTFAPASLGVVAFSDVALHQDHALFAAEVGGDISLFFFDKAGELPVFVREVAFSSLPVLPLGKLRDGLVAVAASDAEVAVVWGTGKTLGSDDDVGGYAVFACVTP